ncbi:MAG: alpha-2-macroglobulin family protein, partial [Bacteroidota bacterium]
YEGQLDAKGEAKISYSFPEQVRSGGFIQGRAFVSVFDVTGRSVNQVVGFKAYPKNIFLGVKSSGYYYGTNKDLNFKMVATGPEDADPGRVEANVELIRYEWKTVLERNNYSGRYAYRSVKKEISEWKRDITLGQKPSDFKFKTSSSGRHELRIRIKGETEYLRKSFYAYRWGNATASSFEIDKEGEVEIILDKKQYAPGEKAKALFVSPFTGKMLVTLERDKVYQHWLVDLEKNSQEMEIPIAAEHLPNVYLTATVFRPHNGDQSAPFLVGHGIASITVNEPRRKLNVSIEAPERVKPRTTAQIKVKTGASGTFKVTLAAVDEGILQIKNYQTPDPYSHMYAKRRLSVTSNDLYEFLLPEIVSSNSSSPAGGDEATARRLNPVKSERFKLLATWSGILRTNSSGEVTVPIELPQYNGEVRLMAVAYQGNRFGSADKALKVSDDVILMPSVPRFLSPGDKVKIPVSVMNTTDKAGQVKVNFSTKGALKATTANSQSVQVEANGTSQAIFEVEAPAVGEATLTFKTSGLDDVTEEIKLPVRPAVPYTVSHNGGSIKAGQTITLDVGGDYYPGTLRQSLTVSAFPAVQFSQHLRYLVGYPRL